MSETVCFLDGSWTNSTISPPGELAAPVNLTRPDEDMEACGCSDLKLEYDPNDEPHTVFTCDTELEWKGPKEVIMYLVFIGVLPECTKCT